jgi:methylenetetrahydrofolate dehydrogenase (NADP+)/methenyltetrahydrofolate cyclohydrolase
VPGTHVTERLAGNPVAEAIIDSTRKAVEAGRARGWSKPVLVSVHLGGGTPFAFYLRQQRKIAPQVGVELRPSALPPHAKASQLLSRLEALDRDPAVHGVLLEHPLPAPLDFFDAVGRLAPEKDVDGAGWDNLGRLVAGQPIQAPAVTLAAMAILRHYGIPVAGQRAVVLGRSATVGLPLALGLLARGAGGDATVTVAHSRTADLASVLAGSHVIFSCVGHPGLLTRRVVPRGATVVDVGVSSVPAPKGSAGAQPVGDADARDLDGWAGALTPVPGGVGPVTVAQLMANVVRGWEIQMGGRTE